MSTPKSSEKYENNPFYVGLKGLNLLFNKALGIAILALVLIGINLVSQAVDTTLRLASGDFYKNEAQINALNAEDRAEIVQFFENAETAEIVIIAVIIATFVFIAILLELLVYGVFEYAAARLSENKTVGFGEAFLASLRQLASLLWLVIVVAVKIFLWSLLLIVPGFFMPVRYSLAGTVFFREGLRGNAAVQRSAELTKGAWFTTFASQSLWNIITLGIIQPLLAPGTNAVLYRQLSTVTDAKEAKPAAHWLSWLTFFGLVSIAVALLIVLAIVGSIAAINS